MLSSPTIGGSSIANNESCNGAGIGVYSGSPLVPGNNIINNRGCASAGAGGLEISGNAEIVENFIAGNIAPDGDGGGINFFGAGTVRGNILTGNRSRWGGGISIAGA